MSSIVHSVIENGSSGVIIDVECQLSNGLPGILIVGFANKAVEEARERVRSAFASSKLDMPRKRITVNLAPADIPKDSTSFDLPIACAILSAAEMVKSRELEKTIIIGELGLDGTIRPVRGIIGKILAARSHGYTSFLLPVKNLQQAQLVPGIKVTAVDTLSDLYRHLTTAITLRAIITDSTSFTAGTVSRPLHDFCDISGQMRAKRAMEIAAAGSHNIMLNGPPGSGKTMLAKALPGILPPMSPEEILETTHIHSLSGRDYDQIVLDRPFRAPHHTSSQTAIIGGGTNPRPGEISLAHHGVLFFDEFPEFSRSSIESLRQPLEDKVIHVSRAKDTVTYPADFILVATMNPCPCGNYGSTKPCTCLPHQIAQYERKISGPIVDRIDLYVTVDEVKHRSLLTESQAESSDDIRTRVLGARHIQSERYGSPLKTNATLSNRDVKRHSLLSPDAAELLNTAAERLGISARSYMRIIKVSRTIADLASSTHIQSEHITEALQYRKQDALVYA